MPTSRPTAPAEEQPANKASAAWLCLLRSGARALIARMPRAPRPPFIVHFTEVSETTRVYPQSDEQMAPSRALGRAAGLQHIGLHVVRIPPGRRTSWPHAEEKEEEFAYVLEGEVDAWTDGQLHRIREGDLIAWPAGTGISHTLINNGTSDARVLAGGHTDIPGSRIFYPLNPSRRSDMPWSRWWHDVPRRRLGRHDGLPDARRPRRKKPR
jgi:uncharacterized cupin superfamily protein